MRRGTAGGGSQSRTSPTVSGRFRTIGLMSAIEERIVDRHVLKLLRAMLRAGVMEDGAVTRERDRNPAGRGDLTAACATSTCTGSTGSGQTRGHGVLVRFADDLLVMCRTRAEAEAALGALRQILARAGP